MDPSCTSSCEHNDDLKCHFPIKLWFCPQHTQFLFVCLSLSLSLNRLPLRSQPLLSPSHICHLRLNRWEKDKSRKMRVGGKRLHSSSVRLASRLQIYIFPVGEYENGKMPSKFPACQSVNRLIRELQHLGEVSVSLGRCAYTHQQRWLLPAVSFCLQTFILIYEDRPHFQAT